MSIRRQTAQNLAAALLTGTWSSDSMVDHASQAWGSRKGRWLNKLVSDVLIQYPATPDFVTLTNFIEGNRYFKKAWRRVHWKRIPIAQRYWVTPAMTPAAGNPSTWDVPAIVTEADLADWLDVELDKLDWFADRRSMQGQTSTEKLHHYRYRWIAKRHGRFRLLEMPKPEMKRIQRRILDGILSYIPAHPSAHAFRRGRSIRSFAEPHAGQRIVVHMDLKDFFPSVYRQRVFRIFTTAGYPEQVARLLAALCTNLTPSFIIRKTRSQLPYSIRQHLETAHLPQGAPTSPALANLSAYRLDCRLTGLARHFGAKYTRYADDLAFSGDRSFERAVKRFWIQVGVVALDEGFDLNMRKTRFMRQAVRQQLAGVVVNEHVNFNRREFDRLKAILHNCGRLGPASQNQGNHANFREHLAGHIAHVIMLNSTRGEKLRRLFDRIEW